MNTPLLALLVALATTLGADDYAKQAKYDLTELHETVSKRLPTGWTAKISPTIPALVISSDEPVSVEYRMMASFQLAKRVEEPVEIRLVAMVYVSPDEYQQINKQNEANTKQRLAFEDNNLSHLFKRVTSSNKIERPYPPEAYAPQTKKEKEIITEYAFLWLNTRSKTLPSHRFKTISFELEGLEADPLLMASIAEQQTEKQYRDILNMLETVAAPYKKR